MIKKFFTSRKTIIAILLLASATFLVAYNKMTIDQWIEIVKWLYGLFIAGNVASKFGSKNE